MFDRSPQEHSLDYFLLFDIADQKLNWPDSGSGAPRIVVNDGTNFRVGTQEFCFELSGVKFSGNSDQQHLVSLWDINGQRSWRFYHQSGDLFFNWSTDGAFDSNKRFSGAWAPSSGVEHDLAVERDGSDVIRIYADGSVIASQTVTDDFFASTAKFAVGGSFDGGTARPDDRFRGTMAWGPRLTIGASRYGGAYTPPTPPWPTQ